VIVEGVNLASTLHGLATVQRPFSAPNALSECSVCARHDFASYAAISDGSARLVERMLSTIELAEQFVDADAYMAGSCFSIADIAAYSIMVSVEANISWDRLPNLRR
jgi:glutathione S-transferase